MILIYSEKALAENVDTTPIYSSLLPDVLHMVFCGATRLNDLCHLKQGSRRIGRIHLNKRKNIGETLAVGRDFGLAGISETKV